ncbi:hypothetical protein [Escherichia phage P817]|nr:hypothetical protein [Escherichia phage P817]
MHQDNFRDRYREAIEAGLNEDWALTVSYGYVELDTALGEMDMDQESESNQSVDGIGDDFDYRLKFDDGIPF